MTQVRRVLMVGGGFGGLSAAIGLRQAGLEVDVVERNPAWDVYGVGIIQRVRSTCWAWPTRRWPRVTR